MGLRDIELLGRGFSLIELLVSIGVIMVLLGLALPAMHNARRTANSVTQLKSIQQAGDLLAMFAESNHGRFPLYGEDQFDATAEWFQPLLAAGYLESTDLLDPRSAKMDLRVPFAMSASLCSDATYYRPEAGPYPDESNRPVAPIRTDQMQFPSSKGVLFTWRIGYPVDTVHVAWCCVDLTLVAPIAFGDGSAERLAVEDCYVSAPMRIQELAGVPVFTTWHGVLGRDR
ncbi:MAG: type II secretion system protein [Phycisphaerales bacterium JB054]